jgi:hypothetical protein
VGESQREEDSYEEGGDFQKWDKEFGPNFQNLGEDG